MILSIFIDYIMINNTLKTQAFNFCVFYIFEKYILVIIYLLMYIYEDTAHYIIA